ncbi:hypothetical protein B0H16DRAFT_1305005 [Mycena metata]|uniref:Uncharacterized protein n=1 Tax=Mycena metata TaxID=1033252 RepID=A0AAD7JYQ5_9AGAR|nr:hypothetical protein B0H16DRAFT_1305005 [Mycena metata]
MQRYIRGHCPPCADLNSFQDIVEGGRLGPNNTSPTRFRVLAQEEFSHDSEGQTWVTSENAREVDVSASVGGNKPTVGHCKATVVFKFSSGRGAILAMENTTTTIIDPPGALKQLLDDPSMCNTVVVSEVHACSSYARLLTTKADNTVVLDLTVEPAISGVVSSSATAKWVRHGTSGYFKSQVNKQGDRTFYPLFRLVSRSEQSTSTGIGTP